MKRILLVLTKDNYPSPEIIVNAVPQGMPYIASSLENNGYAVYGLNPNYMAFKNDVKAHLKEILHDKINDVKPDYIGLGGLSADYLFIRDAIEAIRDIDASIPIILGGGIISSDTQFIFDDLMPDFGVLLEGEITVVNLINTLESKGDLSLVHGIVYSQDGITVINEPQKEYVNLDTLPYPNYDIFDMELFYKLSNQDNMYFTGHTRLDPRIIVISGGRSCPFKCTFCYHSTGSHYRNRKIHDIMDEIIYFHQKYHFNIVKFYDELFSVNEARLLELCDAIIRLKEEANIEFDWVCTMRVNQLKLPILKKMKEAGCVSIGFGFESASDIVLKSMKKKIKKADILNAIKMCEETGIGVQGNFIFGDPAETIETQKETVEFFLEYCKDHIVHNGLISPFPGSPLWKHCIDNHVITNKKCYYENIHLGNSEHNLMNMTQIKDEDFFIEIKEALRLEDSLFKSVKLLEISNDENLNVKAVCPHCQNNIRFKYPCLNAGEKLFHKINAAKPIVNFCPVCHKRVLIPTIHLLQDFKSQFEHFVNAVNTLSRTQAKCTIILGNEIRHIQTYIDTTNILQYNGLNLSQLNIAAFAALKKEEKDTMFFNHPFETLNHNSLSDTMNYIVLPHDEQFKVIELLREQNIKDENIIFMKL